MAPSRATAPASLRLFLLGVLSIFPPIMPQRATGGEIVPPPGEPPASRILAGFGGSGLGGGMLNDSWSPRFLGTVDAAASAPALPRGVRVPAGVHLDAAAFGSARFSGKLVGVE